MPCEVTCSEPAVHEPQEPAETRPQAFALDRAAASPRGRRLQAGPTISTERQQRNVLQPHPSSGCKVKVLQLPQTTMPRGDKSSYTDKQKRQAEHIEAGYEDRGVPKDEAQRRAWATVNKETGGGKKSGSGRGKAAASRTAAERSASARKGAQTRKRNAAAGTPPTAESHTAVSP